MTTHPRSQYLSHAIVESAVGLVLTEDGDRANAMTVSFFSEAAHYPTTCWISIAQTSYTHHLLRASGHFSLIVLHEKQKEIATLCGSLSGRHHDKCARLKLYRGPQGFLCLNDSIASVACRIRSEHPLHDHTLFIADMIAADVETRSAVRRHLLTIDLV
jgi:flavin reductase (DIM6/NTAB) family NADH-FMN oxidoreductase RutF